MPDARAVDLCERLHRVHAAEGAQEGCAVSTEGSGVVPERAGSDPLASRAKPPTGGSCPASSRALREDRALYPRGIWISRRELDEIHRYIRDEVGA